MGLNHIIHEAGYQCITSQSVLTIQSQANPENDFPTTENGKKFFLPVSLPAAKKEYWPQSIGKRPILPTNLKTVFLS
jgi:hypothetical protein